MFSNCLTLDLGTSWAKLAAYALAKDGPVLLGSERVASGVGEYDGSPHSLERFLALCETLEGALSGALSKYSPTHIGLTGIREGLVLLDGSGRPLWVSGNALLDTDRLLDRWIGGIDIAEMLPVVLEHLPSAYALLSLQGYLAYRLTGRLCITGSELDALGLLGPSGQRLTAERPLLAPLSVVAPGETVGTLYDRPQTSVFLAGTDEHASHHGVGLGSTADLGLATATFWSLTAPTRASSAGRPEVRFIPALPPHRAYVSVIGYRWGPLLQQALAGEVPALGEALPRWALGEVVAALRQGRAVAPERLLDCAVNDLRAATELLRETGTVPADPLVAVHGGGLTGLRAFTLRLLDQWGCRWVEVEGDATQRGCCLLAEGP